MYDGPARVELSGTTTANWVAKTANLLVDSLAGPRTVGVLLPLHWQAVVVLLAGVTTGARVTFAQDPAGLAGCEVAFVLAGDAAAALAAGVEDVLALSGHPLGAPAGPLPGLVVDYAREVPSYADHYGGSSPSGFAIDAGGAPVTPLPGLSAEDRVLTTVPPSDPAGAAVLLGALLAGAGLVLLRNGDPEAVAAAERVTATAGTPVPGLTRRA